MNAVVRQAEFVDADSAAQTGYRTDADALTGAGAEGESELVRHRFSVDDMEAMFRAGILNDDMRLELIGGELVEMAADGPLHRNWSVQLNWWLNQQLGLRYAIIANATLRLAKEEGPSPDWCVYDRTLDAAAVRGADVLLAIEQADTSMRRDLTTKSALYAAHGVRDYWVLDLNRERLHVHRDPGADGYGSVRVFEAGEAVEALLIPGLSLRLADVPRVGRGAVED